VTITDGPLRSAVAIGFGVFMVLVFLVVALSAWVDARHVRSLNAAWDRSLAGEDRPDGP